VSFKDLFNGGVINSSGLFPPLTNRTEQDIVRSSYIERHSLTCLDFYSQPDNDFRTVGSRIVVRVNWKGWYRDCNNAFVFEQNTVTCSKVTFHTPTVSTLHIAEVRDLGFRTAHFLEMAGFKQHAVTSFKLRFMSASQVPVWRTVQR